MSARYSEEWLSKRLAKQGAKGGVAVARISKSSKRSKYRSVKTDVDGIRFDSKKESVRWQELKLLVKAGKITNLARQVKFSFDIEGYHICNFIADFTYDENGEVIVEDVKSVATKTRAYQIKKKLLKALYRLDTRET